MPATLNKDTNVLSFHILVLASLLPTIIIVYFPTMSVGEMRANARALYAKYNKWPNPLRYNSNIKLKKRIIALNKKCKTMKECHKHRKANGKPTVAYQRIKLELKLLCFKKIIAYPEPNNRKDPTPVTVILTGASMRMQDSFYMPRAGTKEERAKEAKEQILDILFFASGKIEPMLPTKV